MQQLLFLFMTIICCVVMVKNESSFFKLVHGCEEEIATSRHVIRKEFFACSLEKRCTNVVRYKALGKYEAINGKEELKEIKERDFVWEKVQLPKLPGKYSCYLSDTPSSLLYVESKNISNVRNWACQ